MPPQAWAWAVAGPSAWAPPACYRSGPVVARTAPAIPALLLALVVPPACSGAAAPGAARPDEADAGTWAAWLALEPVVEAARHHASGPVAEGIAEAGALAARGKIRAADARLARLARAGGDPWVAVARADLVAFYFTTCVRGVAFRLEDTEPGRAPAVGARERIDGEDARLEPGDVSVEALLEGVERALAAGIDELSVHAQMARARVAAYASACPPNPEVARRADEVLRADLAELAAAGRLAPDLAYMWGAIQMAEYSGAAARPFLERARRGGFDDPSLPLMLAIADKDAGDLAQARKWAQRARARFEAAKDRSMQAEAEFVLAEIAAASGQDDAALRHYDAALALDPHHVQALLGRATFVLRREGEGQAVRYLGRALAARFSAGPWDEATARRTVAFGEALVLAAGDEPALVQAVRDALVLDVEREDDPGARALRYFFAATLDARLAEYDRARGHALLARQELADAAVALPIDVDEVLDNLPESAGP